MYIKSWYILFNDSLETSTREIVPVCRRQIWCANFHLKLFHVQKYYILERDLVKRNAALLRPPSSLGHYTYSSAKSSCSVPCRAGRSINWLILSSALLKIRLSADHYQACGLSKTFCPIQGPRGASEYKCAQMTQIGWHFMVLLFHIRESGSLKNFLEF